MSVEITNLHKSYHGKKALDGVDLSLKPGEVVGLFGPNGSGKTTLIKILANLLMHYDGEVLIDSHKPGVATKKIVSYLPDVNYLEDGWKVRYCVSLFESFYEDFDKERALKLLEQFHFNLDDRVKSLSKGNKEKLQVILVLARRARLYLFDEPIAGVDPASRDVIFELITQNYDPDATVVITTHLISDIENIVDHVVFINEGKIFLDKSRSEVEEEYPGETIDQVFRKLFKLHSM